MPTEPAALTIEHVPLDQLHTDVGNARRHDQRNLQAISDSLRQFGQVEPLVVQASTGRVVGGNGRLEAMRHMGWASCDIVRRDLSDARAAALGIALNRAGEMARWDAAALEQILEAVEGEFPAEMLGFDEGDLQRLLHPDEPGSADGAAGEAAAPEAEQVPVADWQDTVEVDEPPPPEVPITQAGDIWVLGEHRLACGDCRDRQLVDQLMDGRRADMVATDPPYGVAYKGGSRPREAIENDDGLDLLPLLHDSFAVGFAVCRPGAIWYVACPSGPKFQDFCTVFGGLQMWRQTLVWVKNNSTFGRSDYHQRHEAILYGWVPGAAHRGPPDRKQDTVWEIDRPSRSPDHPTMKPIAMYAKMCQMSTSPGDLVYEPFSGSGTTLLACEQTGRACRAMELSPAYVDVAVRRWEELTGKKAERQPNALARAEA